LSGQVRDGIDLNYADQVRSAEAAEATASVVDDVHGVHGQSIRRVGHPVGQHTTFPRGFPSSVTSSVMYSVTQFRQRIRVQDDPRGG